MLQKGGVWISGFSVGLVELSGAARQRGAQMPLSSLARGSSWFRGGQPRGYETTGQGAPSQHRLAGRLKDISDPDISRKRAPNEASSLYRNRMCNCVCDMREE